MATLKIRLFGRFSAERAGQPLEGLRSKKLQELFGYLFLNRGRAFPRESVASQFWSNSTTRASKKLLRQAFWQLQTTLERARGRKETAILLIEPDWVRVNPNADLVVDVAEFESAVSQVSGIPGHRMSCRQAAALKNALELYSGPFLDGCYHEWCLLERERLERLLVGALDMLMGYCLKHRKLEAGIACGMRGLRVDRARERTHRRLMRLYWLAGDRTGALRQYESCRKVLDEELKVQPSHKTEALRRRIQYDSFAPTRADALDIRRAHGQMDDSRAGSAAWQALAALQDLSRLVERTIRCVRNAMTQEHQARMTGMQPRHPLSCRVDGNLPSSDDAHGLSGK